MTVVLLEVVVVVVDIAFPYIICLSSMPLISSTSLLVSTNSPTDCWRPLIPLMQSPFRFTVYRCAQVSTWRNFIIILLIVLAVISLLSWVTSLNVLSLSRQTVAWTETLLYLLSHSDPEVHYRGAVAVHLMVNAHKDVARTVINTHCKVGTGCEACTAR